MAKKALKGKGLIFILLVLLGISAISGFIVAEPAEESTKTVSFAVTPDAVEGLEIKVDGTPLDGTDLTISSTKEGGYNYAVSAPGYKTVEGNLDYANVEDGQTISVALSSYSVLMNEIPGLSIQNDAVNTLKYTVTAKSECTLKSVTVDGTSYAEAVAAEGYSVSGNLNDGFVIEFTSPLSADHSIGGIVDRAAVTSITFVGHDGKGSPSYVPDQDLKVWDTITLSGNPNSDYYFNGFRVGGETVPSSYVISSSNITIEVSYSKKPVWDKNAVTLETGENIALVDGTYYINDAVTSYTVENVGVTDTDGVGYSVLVGDGTTFNNVVASSSENFTVESANLAENYIQVKDAKGTDLGSRQLFTVDDTAPVIGVVSAKVDDQSVIEEIIRAITFGIFCKEKVTFTVESVTDVGSGVAEVKLLSGDEELGKFISNGDDSYSITVVAGDVVDGTVNAGAVHLKESLNVLAVDMVGKKSKAVNESKEFVVFDNEPPTVDLYTINGVTPSYVDKGEDGKWDYVVGNEGSVSFVVTEHSDNDDSPISGFDEKALKVSVNGSELSSENYTATYDYDMGTCSIEIALATLRDLGLTNTCPITVSCSDNSGNTLENAVVLSGMNQGAQLCLDGEAPHVVFSVSKRDSDKVIAIGDSDADYGYWFKEEIDVTVNFDDITNQIPGSGVKEVVFYAEGNSVDGIIVDRAFTEKDGKFVFETSEYVPSGSATFTIPKNFKGQIYASVTDNEGLTTGTAENSFVSPDKFINESLEDHNGVAEVKIVNPGKESGKNGDVPIYADDVTVQFHIEDKHSGLGSIVWTAVGTDGGTHNSNGDYEGGKTEEIDESIVSGGSWVSGNVNADSLQWDTSDVEIESDQFVTSVTGEVTFSAECNEYVVKLSGTDIHGYAILEDIIVFSIDKTGPEITVEYDIVNAVNGKYFNSDRTATVTVIDNNITAENANNAVNVKVTDRVSKDDPVFSGFKQINVANGEKHKYQATVTYDEGAYEFGMSFADMAGNQSAITYIGDAPNDFVVDKTAPVLSVVYDNNSVRNGNYYKANRTATVTIEEHNFDNTSDFGFVNSHFSITETGDGGGVIPEINGWTSDKDVRTATIDYNYDGFFHNNFSYVDLAGNSAVVYADEFYIDKTAPQISISGVSANSSNNGPLSVNVTFTDTNIDASSNAVFNGAKNGAETLSGVSVTKNFGIVRESDDLYNLNATAYDKAGNSSNQQMTFIVNRFGSIYYIEGVENGGYMKPSDFKSNGGETNIVIHEINVDNIEEGEEIDDEFVSYPEIVVFEGAQSSVLEEGTDFEIEVNSVYGGWNDYCYIISDSVFSSETKYGVKLYSKDNATNDNESTSETIWVDENTPVEVEDVAEEEEEPLLEQFEFTVDGTAPECIVSDLESNAQYNEKTKVVTLSVSDNVLLSDLYIEIDGEKVESLQKSSTEEDSAIMDGTYTFEINEKSGFKNAEQDVKIYCVDAAGNITNLGGSDEEPCVAFDNVVVSTSFWVRFFHNTPLLIGSILLILALIGGCVFFLRKRKNMNAENK